MVNKVFTLNIVRDLHYSYHHQYYLIWHFKIIEKMQETKCPSSGTTKCHHMLFTICASWKFPPASKFCLRSVDVVSLSPCVLSWGKVSWQQNRMGFGSGMCHHTLKRQLKDKTIPAVVYLYKWQWSSNKQHVSELFLCVCVALKS